MTKWVSILCSMLLELTINNNIISSNVRILAINGNLNYPISYNIQLYCSSSKNFTLCELKCWIMGFSTYQVRIADNRLHTGLYSMCVRKSGVCWSKTLVNESSTLTYEDVTGGGVSLLDRHGFTAHAAAAAAGSVFPVQTAHRGCRCRICMNGFQYVHF